MIVVPVPGEIILLHALGQFRRFGFQLFGHFEPVTSGGNSVHAFLIERIRQNVGAGNAVAGLREQALDTARRMKAKIRAVRAPEHLIDFCLQGDVHRVFGFFDDRIENDESAAALQYPHDFLDHA